MRYNGMSVPYVRRLVWDAWNVAHIARHQVTPEEVEAVCHGEPVEGEAYGGRLMLIGPTGTGRMLAVVLSPQADPGVFYVVTARDADRKERRLYRAQKGGGTP
jgi:uncharacterized DUF497 family protein